MDYPQEALDWFHAHQDVFARYYRADTVKAADDRTMALAALLLSRTDWPRLQVAENEHGNFDVVVRVDGGYGREDAEEKLRWYATEAAKIQGSGSLPLPREIGRDVA